MNERDFLYNELSFSFILNRQQQQFILSSVNKIRQQKIRTRKKFFVFQQRVKSLNFATIIFRSNIVFATVKLAQFLNNLNANHVAIANRIIVYLNDIKNLIIEFSKNSSKKILDASDVAFADNELIKKSSNDYLFKLYNDSID